MVRADDGIIKGILFFLLLFVAFYLLANLGVLKSNAIVSISTPDKLMGGSTESYKIYLKTDEPLAGTPSTYKEQYGVWYLTDVSGNIITRGTPLKLSGGIYSTEVKIKFPTGYKVLNLYAQIVETSFENYQKISEVIKAEDKIPIQIATCNLHSDCSSDNLCMNSFGYCNAGLCEAKGDCKVCTKDLDCFSSTKNYECIDSQCSIEPTQSIIQQFTSMANEPLTQPGDVVSGEKPEPKPVPQTIYIGVFALIIILIIIFFKKRRG